MLKYVCSRKRAQPRLVNLTFGVVCVTRMAGMAAIEFSMRRGLTPQRPEGFGEGELAGREPGYRLSRRRGVMPLLLFCHINMSYMFRRGLDVSEIAEMCWKPRRHMKRKSSFSVNQFRIGAATERGRGHRRARRRQDGTCKRTQRAQSAAWAIQCRAVLPYRQEE